MSVTVIAELSLNHGGNVDVAYEMIQAAKEAGCDGVKLQTHRTKDFLPEGHKDWAMFHEAEIWPHIGELVRYAHDLGLVIGTTPTGFDGVEEAVAAGVDFLKNGSDFLLRHDLIEAMLATGLPTWVSTGMADDDEWRQVPDGAKLMICTSAYPCPDEEANLLRLWRVGGSGRFAGFSDHTQSAIGAVCATFVGVEMIEKHFTTRPGTPDAEWSLTPAAMKDYVATIRRTEVMCGHNEFRPTPSEAVNRDRWRVKKGTLRG